MISCRAAARCWTGRSARACAAITRSRAGAEGQPLVRLDGRQADRAWHRRASSASTAGRGGRSHRALGIAAIVASSAARPAASGLRGRSAVSTAFIGTHFAAAEATPRRAARTACLGIGRVVSRRRTGSGGTPRSVAHWSTGRLCRIPGDCAGRRRSRWRAPPPRCVGYVGALNRASVDIAARAPISCSRAAHAQRPGGRSTAST